MDPVGETISFRGLKYGKFENNAQIAQQLKSVMRASVAWGALSDDTAEALDMIATKISRILAGDPSYIDSWHDIQGYAKLIEDRLTKEKDCNVY